jgi:MFS family permease
MINRNLVILLICQAVGISGATMVIILGGIVGTSLAPAPILTSLPMSLMIVGLASTTVPAAMLMKRFGRRVASSVAALVAAGMALFAAYGVYSGSFLILCIAATFIGAHGAFVQQYRFAAAESVPSDKTVFGISVVLFGSVAAGYVGPQVIKVANGILGTPDFVAPLTILSLLYIVAAILLIFLRIAPGQSTNQKSPNNQEIATLNRSNLFLAVAAGAAAYGIMNLIMTATPISMHVFEGFSINDTASVIQAHVIAMYLPSIFTGLLIKRFGGSKIMVIGACFLAASSFSVVLGQTLTQYFAILVLIGIGWNFLYISGTDLLVKNSPHEKRFRIQAVNEFSVFGTAAIASLLSGALIHSIGWQTLNLISLPILLSLILAILVIGFRGRGGLASAVQRDR